ncbi:NAD(P)/FAD-dependent oxidoreductase [Ilumatobacter sp.]|uniref:NAD(P)/FAD-dependent oxidoreductase n=1 Tax=Ilumatobacter sp. TaxID=1967498 RepID=UPI003C69A39B
MSRTAADGIVVVGGGYAGVHAARSIIRAGRRAFIVDPTGQHDYVTRLAAVAGGTAPTVDASSPLTDFSDDVIVASMVAVDDGVVTLDDGRELTADAVVVTAGAVPSTPPIPGIELAAPLRTADDALALRERVDIATSVVIIGGGATGVQLAGAIASRHRHTRVSLIEADTSLLAAMRPETGRDAARILLGRGVDVRLGSGVERIEDGAVVVDGESIDGLVVWAAGFSPRAAKLGCPTTATGRIDVDETLLVRGTERTFAAGDIAGHVDADGSEFAMSAQVAVQAGAAAGDNAVRVANGETPDPVTLDHRGWVLDLGGCRGLAEVGPLTFSAPFLDVVPPLLHWGIDVKHLLDSRGFEGLLDRPR